MIFIPIKNFRSVGYVCQGKLRNIVGKFELSELSIDKDKKEEGFPVTQKESPPISKQEAEPCQLLC